MVVRPRKIGWAGGAIGGRRVSRAGTPHAFDPAPNSRRAIATASKHADVHDALRFLMEIAECRTAAARAGVCDAQHALDADLAAKHRLKRSFWEAVETTR